MYATRFYVCMESHVNQVSVLYRVFTKIRSWLYNATWSGLKMMFNLVNSYIYPSHICNDMHIVTTLYPNVDTHTNKENYILFDGQWVLTKWVIEKPRKMMSCHTQVVIDTRPSESPPLHVYVHMILSFPL